MLNILIILFLNALVATSVVAVESNRTDNGAEFQSNIFDEIDTNLKLSILEFIDLNTLQSVRRTNKYFNGLLGPNSYFRNHIFDLTLIDGTRITLKDYLQGDEKKPVVGIKNLANLIKESPNTFIALILEIAPPLPEEDAICLFYERTLQIDQLIASIPTYESSQQRLTYVIIELLIWAHVRSLVEVQIEHQVRRQIGSQAWDEVKIQIEDQVRNQVWNQIRNRNQIWNLIKNKVGSKVWSRIGGNIEKLLNSQIKSRVWEPINEVLSKYDFLEAYDVGKLNEILKPAIDYTFMVYQLGALAMRYSASFNVIRKGHSIGTLGIDEKRASEVIDNLSLPVVGSKLIETQSNLIKTFMK